MACSSCAKKNQQRKHQTVANIAKKVNTQTVAKQATGTPKPHTSTRVDMSVYKEELAKLNK